MDTVLPGAFMIDQRAKAFLGGHSNPDGLTDPMSLYEPKKAAGVKYGYYCMQKNTLWEFVS